MVHPKVTNSSPESDQADDARDDNDKVHDVPPRFKVGNVSEHEALVAYAQYKLKDKDPGERVLGIPTMRTRVRMRVRARARDIPTPPLLRATTRYSALLRATYYTLLGP